MKKVVLQSLIVATCASVFTVLIIVPIYFFQHPPVDWGLIRFGLIMGYMQQLITISPTLIFFKILIGHSSKIFYSIAISVLFFALQFFINRVSVSTDARFLILELVAIIGFDLLLYRKKH